MWQVVSASRAPMDFTGSKKRRENRSRLRDKIRADRLEHLSSNSPVYYKGIQVGSVQDIEITDDARLVRFSLFIEHRFTPLVRANTNFWIVPGIDVKGGLFSGLKLELGPLRALLAGGIEFATPDTKGTPARDGAEYPLFDEPKDAWTTWGPQIQLLPADGEESATTQESQPQEQNSLQKTLQGKQ
jgi:paraquat-inducible protein B